MFERLRQMLIKEFIQVFRDPRMRGVVLILPCVQMLVIGYAVNTDVRDIRTVVHDLDQSVESRELVARMLNSGYFTLVAHVDRDEDVRRLIDRGEASLVVAFQRGFGADLQAGRTAHMQLILDGSDSNTASVVMSYASRIANHYSQQVLVERFERRLGAVSMPGQVELRWRAWFNENLESRNYFVPGVLVVVLTLVTLLLTAMSVVREKEIGTIEQIMVTPITPGEFILGKTIPFAVIGFIDVILIVIIGVFWFGVPIRGSIPLLFGATGLYLLTTLGVGLYISTVSQTQQQAMMSTFFFFFPAMMLSGFVFPIANMPTVVQWLTLINPMRYFLVVVRGLFLKGVGLPVLWPQLAILAGMGITILGLAARRFHKTL